MRNHFISPLRVNCLHALLCVALSAQAGLAGDYTTLSVNSDPGNGPLVFTNSITIGSNQVAQIVAYPVGLNGNGQFYLDVEIGGFTYTFRIYYQGDTVWRDITPVAGPATIQLRCPTNVPYLGGFCTVRVTPGAFSPEKTVVVTPSSGGANVSLEISTNLAAWSTATNGIYSGLNNANFFRINLNRSGFVPPVPPDGSIASQADAQTTTLYARGAWGAGQRPENELSINEYQTAEIVAVGPTSAGLNIWHGSQLFQFSLIAQTTAWRDLTPMRGPATFQLVGDSYCTIRVYSEQYPPDKTLITLPGTNSYAVSLEGSTDLVNWTAATNGTYTVPQAMFFRIRSDIVTPP